MPADNGAEARNTRIKIEPGKIMQHIQGNIACLRHFRFTKSPSPIFSIGIASHCNDRCNSPQLFQNIRRADIACVDNQGYPRQSPRGFRPSRPMSIRDHADEHLFGI